MSRMRKGERSTAAPAGAKRDPRKAVVAAPSKKPRTTARKSRAAALLGFADAGGFWRSRIFTANDVKRMVPPGWNLCQPADVVASSLFNAFSTSTMQQLAMNNKGPRGHAAKAAAMRVHSAAYDLLRLLGIPPEAASDFSGNLSVLHAAEYLPICALSQHLMDVMTSVPVDVRKLVAETYERRYHFGERLLEFAPRVLGLIAATSNRLATAIPKEPTGPKRSHLSRVLFAELARVHFAAFGKEPELYDNVSEPTGRSVMWVRWVLKVAEERWLEAAGTEQMRAVRSWIRAESCTSCGTLARNLSAGWKRAKPGLS